MTTVTYIAQQSIMSGHTVGLSYEYRLRCVALEHARDILKNEVRALSGKTETLLWRNKRMWSVTTAALRSTELNQAREFLDSVIGGSPFTFDEFGQPATPFNPVTGHMPGTYAEARAIKQGDGGVNDYFRFSFSIVEQ